MINIINSILRTENSDKGGEQDNYEVCDHYGHSYRDYKQVEVTSMFHEIQPYHQYHDGILVDAVPGSLLGVQYLQEVKEAPCRDCPETKSQKNVLQRRVVYEEDGEVKSICWSNYEDLEDKHCNLQ